MGVYQREGSKNWWLRYRDANGKLVRRSANTTIKTVALARLAGIEAEVLADISVESVTSNDLPGMTQTDKSLDQRITDLEDLVRRLLLERKSLNRFLEASARSSERMLRG